MLNLMSAPVYIGGIEDRRLLPKSLNVTQMFSGAIQRVTLNTNVIDTLLKVGWFTAFCLFFVLLLYIFLFVAVEMTDYTR